MDVVKKLIGGRADADWIQNTCALRLSRALNYAGLPLPAQFQGMEVITGADKRHYAFRMQELKKWIAFRLGSPTVEVVKPVNSLIDRTAFTAKQGIVAFDIRFPDAAGHIDLWDGKTYTHEAEDPRDYFALATKVVLWELP